VGELSQFEDHKLKEYWDLLPYNGRLDTMDDLTAGSSLGIRAAVRIAWPTASQEETPILKLLIHCIFTSSGMHIS